MITKQAWTGGTNDCEVCFYGRIAETIYNCKPKFGYQQYWQQIQFSFIGLASLFWHDSSMTLGDLTDFSKNIKLSAYIKLWTET